MKLRRMLALTLVPMTLMTAALAAVAVGVGVVRLVAR